MTIRGIDGGYGWGKSCTVARIAFNSQGPKTIIFTNMVLNKKMIQNVIEYGEGELLKVLRTCNFINDLERLIYKHDEYIETEGLPFYERKEFTKFIIIEDESGSHLNAHSKDYYDAVYYEYINQQRKIGIDFYLVSVKGSENTKILRGKVEEWIEPEPFGSIWPLSEIVKVSLSRRKEDGETTIMREVERWDDNGNRYIEKIPERWHWMYYWKPFSYKLYDDLHKNIQDPKRYDELCLLTSPIDLHLDVNAFDYQEETKIVLDPMVQKVVEKLKNKHVLGSSSSSILLDDYRHSSSDLKEG